MREYEVRKMNMNKFTQKSLEAIKEAETLAISNGNIEIATEHLLLSLLKQENGLIPRILEKMGKHVTELTLELTRYVDSMPQVSGPGREAGKIYVSTATDQVLTGATKEADKLDDQYVSVEHIFYSFFMN